MTVIKRVNNKGHTPANGFFSTSHEARLSKRLGTNLAAYRKAQNHTQKSLAESIGVDKESISRFERGVALPSLQTLEKLGGELNIPLSDLIGEEAAQVNKMAVILSQWLNEMDEESRQYLFDLIKSLYPRLRAPGTRIEKRKEPRSRPQ